MNPTITNLYGPPGTGKTHRCIQTVESWLTEGVAPERIGYYAYTKAASIEATERIAHSADHAAGEFSWFKTLHAAAFALCGLHSSRVFSGPKITAFMKAEGFPYNPYASEDDYAEGSSALQEGNVLLSLWDRGRNTLAKNAGDAWEGASSDVRSRTDAHTFRRFVSAYEGHKKANGFYDYADMILLALDHGDTTGCSHVIIDECLPYRTPILLADGSSKPIGEIVENKEPVTVLAYDTQTNEQKRCKVTGWQKLPNRKPLVKVKVKQAKKDKRNGNYPTYFVVCTIDHKIWADGEWTPAGELKPGMVAQVETSAKKSQSYKITRKGREILAQAMCEKNEKGIRQTYIPSIGRSIKNHRKGNGTGLTVPQKLLLEALGEGWAPEYPVLTGGKNSEHPPCYKIDIAHPARKVAIEVDGRSHRYRKDQDQKKDAFLQKQGWQVFRIPNRRAVQETDQVIQEILSADCPAPALVVSVEPVSIPDYFVYDLTVEECHNFYANGVLVHNCQDLSPLQWRMARLCEADAKVILRAGDDDQAIYSFMGARAEDYVAIEGEREILSQSYRVPQAVHAEALRIIEENRNRVKKTYRPTESEGSFSRRRSYAILPTIPPGETAFYLFRNKRHLKTQCDEWLDSCVPFASNRYKNPLSHPVLMNGLRALLAFLDRGEVSLSEAVSIFETLHCGPMQEFRYEKDALSRLKREAASRPFQKTKDVGLTPEGLAAAKRDPFFLADRIKDARPGWKRYLKTLVTRHGTEILFEKPRLFATTVHGAKGMEADRVYISQDATRKCQDGLSEDPETERRIKYVAVTRAKKACVILPETAEGGWLI